MIWQRGPKCRCLSAARGARPAPGRRLCLARALPLSGPRLDPRLADRRPLSWLCLGSVLPLSCLRLARRKTGGPRRGVVARVLWLCLVLRIAELTRRLGSVLNRRDTACGRVGLTRPHWRGCRMHLQ